MQLPPVGLNIVYCTFVKKFRPISNFCPNFVQNCEFRFFVKNAKFGDFVRFPSKKYLPIDLCNKEYVISTRGIPRPHVTNITSSGPAAVSFPNGWSPSRFVLDLTLAPATMLSSLTGSPCISSSALGSALTASVISINQSINQSIHSSRIRILRIFTNFKRRNEFYFLHFSVLTHQNTAFLQLQGAN